MTSGTTDENAVDAVRIEELRKEFGDLVALDDVSLTIREGEFFTLLGPSGCGKSTLLRIISGLEETTGGMVRIKGERVERTPPEKRPTSMVFQHLALFPHKTVYENLTFGLKMQGTPKAERRKRADEMLALLDLQGYEESAIDELSGGQQQRIALGRSLLTTPEILLLDEPLSSLDAELRKEMQLELRRIQSELGATFLYVTHDQEVALTASDRIAVLNEGTVEQIGTPQEIYQSPATEFVAQFIGDTNLLEGDVVEGDDGTATVAVADGLTTDTAYPANDVAEDRVDVSLRPELITIADECVEADNVFEATVRERVYQGTDTVYFVDVDGLELRVRQPAKERVTEFEDDASVWVAWANDAVDFLGRDGT